MGLIYEPEVDGWICGRTDDPVLRLKVLWSMPTKPTPESITGQRNNPPNHILLALRSLGFLVRINYEKLYHTPNEHHNGDCENKRNN